MLFRSTLVFDKTGTVTKGLPAVVSDWWATGVSERDHQLLVSVETVANHPLAKAVLKYEAVAPLPVDESKVLAGQGMVAQVAGATVFFPRIQLVTLLRVRIRNYAEQHSRKHEECDFAYHIYSTLSLRVGYFNIRQIYKIVSGKQYVSKHLKKYV